VDNLRDRSKKPKKGLSSSIAGRRASEDSIGSDAVADIAIDLWKISCRAQNEGANERVIAACERAEDRLKKLGFETIDFKGQPYDSNMRVKVVEHDGGVEPYIIAECLRAAVYFRGELLKEAEVITKGS
jgi:hypothetical protein